MVERDRPVCSKTSGNRHIFFVSISLLFPTNLFDLPEYAQNCLESSKKSYNSRIDFFGKPQFAVVHFTFQNESKIGQKMRGQRWGASNVCVVGKTTKHQFVTRVIQWYPSPPNKKGISFRGFPLIVPDLLIQQHNKSGRLFPCTNYGYS